MAIYASTFFSAALTDSVALTVFLLAFALFAITINLIYVPFLFIQSYYSSIFFILAINTTTFLSASLALSVT